MNSDILKVHCTLRELQLALLEVLSDVINLCEENNLRYYAFGGTCLGAVRHSGFIPWDDDIDVMMMRDQYDILCSIAAKEFNHPYFFQTEQTDPGCVRGHAQLRNSETTGILKLLICPVVIH